MAGGEERMDNGDDDGGSDRVDDAFCEPLTFSSDDTVRAETASAELDQITYLPCRRHYLPEGMRFSPLSRTVCEA